MGRQRCGLLVAMLFAACSVGHEQSAGNTAAANVQLDVATPVGGWDLAVSGQHVLIAWSEPLPEGHGDIVELLRSDDDGATFAPKQRLAGPGAGLDLRRVIASGSNVYVLWTEGSTGAWVRMSEDSGLHFGPPQAIPLRGIDAAAAAGDSLYVLDSVAREEELADFQFVASQDRGATWGAVQVVNQNGRYGDVSLLAREARVFLLWDDGGTNDDPTLFFRESADKGVSFGPIVEAADGARSIGSAKMALGGGRLHLVWSQCSGFSTARTCQVASRHQPGEGQPFSATQVVTPTADRFGATDLAVDGDAVHVVWLRGSATASDLLYRRSVDGGGTFESEQQLTATPSWLLTPQVAAGGGNVYVTWNVEADAETLLYLLKGQGFGTAFGEPELLSSALDVSTPKIAATPAHFHSLHVEWEPGTVVLKYRRR